VSLKINKEYDVSIIVVNYNGKNHLERFFDSILALDTKGPSFEVVFVDNKSTDDSLAFVEERFRSSFQNNLKVIKAPKNLGFAAGNNLGVKHSAGKYIVFLNNDTILHSLWLKQLYDTIINSGAGIVNSKLVFSYDFLKLQIVTRDRMVLDNKVSLNGDSYLIDNKFCKNVVYENDKILCFGNSYFYVPITHPGQKFCLDLNFIELNESEDKVRSGGKEFISSSSNSSNGHIKLDFTADEVVKNQVTLIQNAGSDVNADYSGYDIGFCEEDIGQYEESREINSACGASMILKKDDFLQVGGFDQRFFMYYEDTDLSFRIRSLGKKLIYCPSSIVRHVHAASSKEWSPFFLYHVTKNRLIFILKNFGIKVFFKQLLDIIVNSKLKSSVLNKALISTLASSSRIILQKVAKRVG